MSIDAKARESCDGVRYLRMIANSVRNTAAVKINPRDSKPFARYPAATVREYQSAGARSSRVTCCSAKVKWQHRTSTHNPRLLHRKHERKRLAYRTLPDASDAEIE